MGFLAQQDIPLPIADGLPMRPKTRAINNDNPPGLSPGRGFEERVNRNMWWGARRVPMDEVHEAIMPGFYGCN